MTFDQYLALVLPHATRPDSPDHGVEHWRRVAENGERLAAETPDSDPEVVAAFAALHDSQRHTEFADPRHGLRAAMVLLALDTPDLDRERRVKLVVALVGHDEGRVSDDPTIGVCWDADRLDLPRVGIEPHSTFFSTEAGRAAIGYRGWAS